MESPGTSATSEYQNALLQAVAGPSAGTLIRVGRELRIGRAERGEGGLGSDQNIVSPSCDGAAITGRRADDRRCRIDQRHVRER